jgi:phage minor structural protein
MEGGFPLIHIIDEKTDEILAVFSEEEFWNDEFEENLQGLETFKFTVSSIHPKGEYLSVRRKIVIPGEDGEFKEFILSDPLIYNTTKEIYANGSFIDLRKQKVIDPVVWEGQTSSTAGELVLSGTQFELGIVEYGGVHKVEFEEPIDAYDAIRVVAQIFGLEVRFRVETDGSKVTKRVVDLVKRRGTLSGKEVVFGKDIEGLERKESEGELVTALKCYGPIKEDGTRLMVTVENEEAFQKWSIDGRHLWGIYEPQTDNEDMTKERLLSLGETELNKRSKTSISYSLKTVALEHVFGYEHEKVRLGDLNRVKDEEKSPPIYLEARVISIKKSIKQQAKKEVSYGDFIEYSRDQIQDEWKQIKLQWQKKIASLHPLYVWVMYADDSEGNGISPSPEGKSFIGISYNNRSVEASLEANDYNWSKIEGSQGIPGPAGSDGLPSYVWIKYADDENGMNMSDDPSNKLYMGVASNKNTDSESQNSSDYKWSLIKGEKGDRGLQGEKGPTGLQGIQGPKGDQGVKGNTGADGRTSYTHIAYANNSSGTSGFSVSDSSGKTYVGMYADFNSMDSTNPSDYKWSLIKGADGSQGIQGPKGADGQTPYFHTAWATNSTGTSGFSTTAATGKTYIGTYTDFNSADSNDPSKYNWALIKGDKGDTGNTGAMGPKGNTGATGPQGPNRVDSTTEFEANVIKANYLASRIINTDHIATEGLSAAIIKVGAMLFDRLRGGTLTLGGPNNGNGIATLLNEDGESIFELNAGDVGSSYMYIGKIDSPSVLSVQQESLTFYVNGATGDDLNDGLSSNAPFKTIQAALNKIPKYLVGYVTIEVETQTYNEDVRVIGFTGEGDLTINLNKSGINGRLLIQNCSNIIRVKGQDFNYHAKIGTVNSNHPISIVTSQYVILESLWGKANNRSDYAIYIAASNVYTYHCVHERALKAGMHTTVGGALYAYAGRGSGNKYSAEAAAGSKIHMESRRPAYSVAPALETSGGTVTQSSGIATVYSPGDSASVITEPVTVQQGTLIETSSSCLSWDDRYGWKSGNNLYQGDYGYGNHRGLMFFPSLQSQLSGKTIRSVRLFMTRYNGGGSSASSNLYFYLHNYNSQPSGAPSLGSSLGSLGSYAWRESKWINLPLSVGEALKSGLAKGIAIYSGYGHPYVIMNPAVQIEIKYEG